MNFENWTPGKVLELIDLFRDAPVLWNTRDLKYKDKTAREQAWNHIGNSMRIEKGEAERKMKVLLSQFRREYAKHKELSLKCPNEGVPEPKWFAFSRFSFLERKERKLKHKSCNEVETYAQPEKRLKFDSVPEENWSEEISIFTKFIATKMKTMSQSTRCVVQHKISQVLFKADFGKYNSQPRFDTNIVQPTLPPVPVSKPLPPQTQSTSTIEIEEHQIKIEPELTLSLNSEIDICD